MIYNYPAGQVHVFFTMDMYLPILEKESGVFLTIDEKDPKPVLRDRLKMMEERLQQTSSGIKKMSILRSLMDMVMDTGDENSSVAFVNLPSEDGEGGTIRDRLNALDSDLVNARQYIKDLNNAIGEFREFMLGCGVSVSESDTSLNMTSSILQKLCGSPGDKTSE